MLDFTCCDSLITNFPGTRKESGKPGSRAGARSLQQPYFLGAQCASCPRAFYVIGVLFYYKKRTAYPPQKAVLRHDLKPSHY